MKKVLPALAILLALLLCFSSCSGCNQKNNESEAPTSEPVVETTQAPTEAPTEQPTDEPTDEPSQIDQEFVDKAADMIYEFYKPGKVNTVSADFTLPSSVKYRGEDVTIQWEVVEGAEYADIQDSDSPGLVNVHVNKASSGGPFKIKGIVSAGGYTKEIEFDYELVSQLDLLKAAYALQPGENIDGSTLTGVISKVNTPYDDGYKNVTVTIIVDEHDDMPIMCYRLKGEGADTIKVGDTITVYGTLTNYNGTIEFTSGCTLVSIDNVGEEIPDDSPVFNSDREIVEAAYKLPGGEMLSDTKMYTLTGKVTKVNTPYDESYQNVTVTIVVDGMNDKPIQCYRMKGDDASKVKVTDVIQVTGYLKNYVNSSGKSTIEFDAGCKLDKIVEVGPGEARVDYGTEAQIVDAAYRLAEGDNLIGEQTLTGVVTQINTAYDPGFQNVTVTIVVAGKTDKPIQCFRMKGDDADKVKVTDEIRVTGILKNYVNSSGKSTIEFDAGCHLDQIVKSGAGENAPTFGSMEEIVNAVYALGENQYLASTKEYTLKGKIISVDTPYSADFGNITVTIQVGDMADKPITCYRMKGADDAMQAKLPALKYSDTITVTGLLKDYNGKKEFDTACKMTAYQAGSGAADETVYSTPEEIVNALYALGPNEKLSPSGTHQYTLTGKITMVETAYSEEFGNISVTIVVGNMTDKPITCYRMKGANDAMQAKLAVLKYSDEITVTGLLKDYNGKKEFDAGCLMSAYKAGSETIKIYETPEEIVNALYELPDGSLLSAGHEYSLKGKIMSIDTEYSDEYGNITVTMVVNDMFDKPVKAYRMKGDGDKMTALLPKLKATDVITVKGKLKNYGGTYEFDAGCLMSAYQAGTGEVTDKEKLAVEANALSLTPTLYKKAAEVELPAAGTTYTDVKITWKSDSEYAKVDGGKLIITIPEDKDAEANVTATLKLGSETTTKKFTLTIKAPSSEPAKVYSVDEILAVMKDYTGNQTSEDEYTVRGLVTSSTYKSNYKSYDIWLASDDGKTAQAFQLYSVAIDPSITEDYTAADALAGMYVTCTGYVKLYNSTYEMPYLGASASPTGGAYTPNVTKVEAADLSDAEKVNFEKGKLELTPTTYKKATEVELPKAKTYTDVKITWKSDSKYAKVDSGKLIITLPEDKDATANVTATLKLGTESATKKFTLTIKVASTEPAKVYTVDEILAVMKDYTDKKISEEEYTVRGLVTSSSFNAKYSSYTVWLASDDGKNAKAFELYSVGMDESIQGDYSATDALAGMMVTCTGYVELYGTTYEMPFLYADQSPSGEEYRPTITELEAPELSDAEKVAFEQGKLNLTPTTFTKAAEVTLPKAQTYTDVKITWKTSNKGYAPINNGVMTIVIPKSDRVVTITATLTLGKASATKEFKITIKAPSTEPEKVYTVDEMIALMKDYEDKQISEQEYTVRGVVTSSTYKSNYKSYDIWLASDDGKTAEAFQLYSVGMDPSITGDFTAKDALAGYTVTCKGYVELYSGKYEMPYLNANLSPTGEAYTPNIFEAVVPELSDAEKVAYEQEKLELKPLTFTEAQEVTLPVPKTYTDVQITWKTSNKGYAPIKDGVLTIVIPPSDRTVTITATLTLGEAEATKKFVITIKAKPEVETVPVLITEPVEENAYKLMVEQNNAKKTLYFAGKTANQAYYLATTEEIEDATDVFLEKVTDGFNLYFKDENGAKKYITIEQSGDYVNAGLKDAAAGAYTFDETYLTLMTKIGEKTYYLGSYSSYLTISANDSSRLETDASNQFPARFVGYKAVDELTDAEKVWYEKNQLVVETDEAFTEATEITLPEAKKFTDVTITWKSDSTYAKVSNGKLVITLPEDKDVTATLTSTLKLNTVTETKEFTLTIKAANAAHYVVATTLTVGKTYKLGFCRPNEDPLFFNGEVYNKYYLGVNEEGVDVTLKASGDGYAFEFTDANGSTQYVAFAISGTHVNAVISSNAYAFNYDLENNAFYALASESMGNYYLGGSGSYNDITTIAEKNFASSTFYPCRLYEKQD